MKQYIGKRLLVNVFDNDAPRMTSLAAISPNGKYGLFNDDCAYAESFGWLSLDKVAVVDVIGEAAEYPAKLMRRLSKQVSELERA